MKRRHGVNSEIAFTHIFTRKRQVLVAALGVTVGMSVFIFMNSLMQGFTRYSEEALFKTTPHLRIYKEDKLSQPLPGTGENAVIVNPKITAESKKINNPEQVLRVLQQFPGVVAATPDVMTNVFYNNGRSQVAGRASGVNIAQENAMFNLESTMVDGNFLSLADHQNGIIIGSGIADKLNVTLNDNLTVVSAAGVVKILKITGIFKSGITGVDKTKSYVNISTAQELQREGPSFITDIYVNVKNHNAAPAYVKPLSQLTGYDAEDWQAANASAVAANNVRQKMALAISMSVLLVAGFGIYNILNMTIMQKMNDIAILKAMGFPGKDVVRIFVMQSVLIGIVGVLMGLVMATGIVKLMSNVWVGGDIGYFPIQFEPKFYALGMIFGMVVTIAAGYMPARRAAKVDPVAIFRK